MIKKICKKCKVCSLILALFGAVISNANAIKIEGVEMEKLKTKTPEVKENFVEVYQFYFDPFGARCAATLQLFNQVIKTMKFKNPARFHLINIGMANSAEFVPGYNTSQKGVVIYNPANGKKKVSIIRELLTEGKGHNFIKHYIASEIRSVM